MSTEKSVYSIIIHNRLRYKALKRLSTNEWLNKTCFTHKIKYYSAIERREVLKPATMGINFAWVFLSHKRQSAIRSHPVQGPGLGNPELRKQIIGC
jgi:hypothetical protein